MIKNNSFAIKIVIIYFQVSSNVFFPNNHILAQMAFLNALFLQCLIEEILYKKNGYRETFFVPILLFKLPKEKKMLGQVFSR
jgi:hypothetical protein